MVTMATRREVNSRRVTPSGRALALKPCERRATGTTMWFETMIESAIEETMIIEVALENPPMKAKSERICWLAERGRVSTNISGSAPEVISALPMMAMGTVKMLMPSM